MADKDIKINIKTTADTSGVDRADASVKKLNGTVSVGTVQGFLDQTASKARVSEIAFYDLSEEITRTGNSGASLDPLVGKIERIGGAATTTSGGIKNLSGLATQAGYQITDFAVQVQGGTSAITAFSQQFPQLMGSISASGALSSQVGAQLLKMPIDIGTGFSLAAVAVGIGVKLVSDAYGDMKTDLDNAQAAAKRYQDQIVYMQQQQAALNQQVRREFIADTYKREAEQLERQIKAMERLRELRGAEAGLAQSKAQLEIQKAKNSGGDTTQAQGNAIVLGQEDQFRELAAGIAKITESVTLAEQAAEQAKVKMNEAGRDYGEFSDQYKELEGEYNKAASTADELKLDLEAAKQRADISAQEIIVAGDANMNNLQTEVQAAQLKAATDTKAALDAKAAEMGGVISSNAKASMDILAAVLADGVIKPEEMARIREALANIRASREGADKQILAGFLTLEKTTNNIMSVLPSVINRLSAQEAQSQQLRR